MLQVEKYLDLKKISGNISLENSVYCFTEKHLLNNISLTGSKDKNAKTTIVVNSLIAIPNGVKATFKNISFMGLGRDSYNVFFQNLGDIEFINCDFSMFGDVLVPIFTCSKNSKTSFKNCKFDNCLSVINAKCDSDVKFVSCSFRHVQQVSIVTYDKSTLTVEKCKCEIYDTNFISARGKSKITVNELKLNGKFIGGEMEVDSESVDLRDEVIVNSHSLLLAEEIDNYMRVNPQSICGINLFDKASANIYKSSFKNTNHSVCVGFNTVANVLECTFDKSSEDILVTDKGQLNLYSSVFTGGDGLFVVALGYSTIKIYDCIFKKSEATAIGVTGDSNIKIYDSVVEENDCHGILTIDNADITMNECKIQNNKGGGLYTDGKTTATVTNSSFTDNGLANILISEEAKPNFEHDHFNFTKASSTKLEIHHVVIRNKAKAYFLNDTFTGKDLDYSGIYSQDDSDVFVKYCTFKDNQKVATLDGKSKVYCKDSKFETIGEKLAIGEVGSTFNMVGCKVL